MQRSKGVVIYHLRKVYSVHTGHQKNSFLGYFQPRLLSGTNFISDSLIVNKGRFFSNGNSLGIANCESDDQRAKKRTDPQFCDLGAIELVTDQTTLDKIGQDILYGQIANLSIQDNTGDGELVPASECPQIVGSATDSKGKPWQPGCLEIVQNAYNSSKGTLTLSQNGDITYVPNGNWHGSDEFKLRIITTLTEIW